MRTVLVIGGYGTFGGRIVRLLSSDPGITVIVAGRSHDRAIALRLGRLLLAGAFHFDISIELPFGISLIQYSGRLKPAG